MSTQVFRSRCSVTFALATIFSAFILTASADAQTPTTQPQAPMTEPPPAPMQDPAVPAPWWELIGGYEFDTHGSGYGFFGPAYVRPFKPGLAWTASVFPNYLALRVRPAHRHDEGAVSRRELDVRTPFRREEFLQGGGGTRSKVSQDGIPGG